MGTSRKRMASQKSIASPCPQDCEHGHQKHRKASQSEANQASLLLERAPCVAPGLEGVAAELDAEYPLQEQADGPAPANHRVPLGGGFRWQGERDVVVAGHPVARMMARMAAEPRYPQPNMAIVRDLEMMEGFKQKGVVCFINGVVIPASHEQLRILVIARWRALFHPEADPDRLYRGCCDYDRIMTTDGLQSAIWGFNTSRYIDYLDDILAKRPDVFVALWVRDFRKISVDEFEERCAPWTDAEKPNLEYDGVLTALTSESWQVFLLPSTIMSEVERILEIAPGMAVKHGVSVQAVGDRLKSYRSVEELLEDDDPIGRFIRGLLLSTRFVHWSMNHKDQARSGLSILGKLRAAFKSMLPLQKKYRRVEKIEGHGKPALFMNGLELARFVPTSFQQIAVGLEAAIRLEDWSTTLCPNALKKTQMIIRLAIVCLSNICPPTARSLTRVIASSVELDRLAKRNNISTGKVWRQLVPTVLILGQEGITEDDIEVLDALAQAKGYLEGFAELVVDLTCDTEDAFRSRAALTQFEARECTPSLKDNGWTRGAYPQAWLHPDADVDFLMKCPNFILYAEHLDTEVDLFELRRRSVSIPSSDLRTELMFNVDLPLAHPNEHVQQIFRRPFDHLQITSVIGSIEMQRLAERKEAVVREVAKRFVAWSPLTWDPWLSEKIGSRSFSTMYGIPRKNLLYPWAIRAAAHGSWNRSWDDCGWI